MANNANEKKTEECQICGKVVRELRVHMKVHSEFKPFECDFCEKSFKRKGDLTEHHRIHTGEKPFKCELCGQGFITSSKLSKQCVLVQ